MQIYRYYVKYMTLVILTMLTIAAIPVNAQQKDTTGNRYIESMENLLTIKLLQSSDIDQLRVQNTSGELRLSPNIKTITKIGIVYKIIAVNVGFVMKFLPGNNDDDKYGETKTTTLGVNIITKHWVQEFLYERTKGYYLVNTGDYIKGWTQDSPYIKLPNMTFANYEGSTSYKFNDKFSVKAITTQAERQVRNAGSFMPRLLYRYYTVDNQGPFTGGAAQRSKNFLLELSLGYYYTFALKHNFYFSMGAAGGIGYLHSTIVTYLPGGDDMAYTNSPDYRLDGQFGLGYNGRKIIAGLFASGFNSYGQKEHVTAIDNESNASIFIYIGYRFRQPEVLRKTSDEVEGFIKGKF